MAKHDNDLTLRDVVSHFDLKFQRVDERFDGIDKRLDRVERKVEDLATDLKLFHEDFDAFAEDMYEVKHVFRPDTEQRLDRLEHHAKLSPLPVPVSPV